MKKIVLLTVLLFTIFTSCEKVEDNPQKNLTILYTNDEHGWMEGVEGGKSASELFGLWEELEGYSEDGSFLILSGGDNWTGPALSTWFQGESMVEVMNAMDYDASAIGNHEFDFKVDELKERISEAAFPYLAANIYNKSDGEPVDFAQAYTIVDVNGLEVGIIGLASQSTPYTTFPTHVVDYDFGSYDEALRRVVPEVRNEGADIILVAGHIGYYDLELLSATASELGITLLGGGHSHELKVGMSNGVALIEGGSYFQSYAKAELEFDLDAMELLSIEVNTRENVNGEHNSDIDAIVDYWNIEMGGALSEVIAYTDVDLSRYSNEVRNMICDSWLISIPLADVSLTNTGGIRQDIPKGDITLETIVGLLPFENDIIQLELTGQQLIDIVNSPVDLVMGGMSVNDGYKLSDGSTIQMSETYTVLTTDYLYSRDDYAFSTYDGTATPMNTHYRQPLIDWLRTLQTSVSNPLASYLDYNSRR